MNKLIFFLVALACAVQLALADCDRQQEEEENPCARTLCAAGTTCDVIDGRAQCLCNSYCPQIFAQVCGTDGKTYRVAACQAQEDIQVAHEGQCDNN